MRKRSFIIIVIAMLAGSGGGAGCAGQTKVSTVWKTSQALPPAFGTIAVFVVNATAGERRAGEEEMVRQLPAGTGVLGYRLISDEDLKDKELVRRTVQEKRIDGVVVLRLVASETTSAYYAPRYDESFAFADWHTDLGMSRSSAVHHSSVGYHDDFGSFHYSAGHMITSTIFRTEVSVYNVKDARLLWAGASSTTDPENVQDLIAQVAQASVAELRKQKFIP